MNKETLIKAERERNEAIYAKIKEYIASGIENSEKIQSANDTLDLLSRYEALRACEALCELNLWGRVVTVLPTLQYPDIDPTAKNIKDWLSIEIKSANNELNRYIQ
ncbi:MAG: hypothetical protein UD103_07895 [Bacteroidales bacterium]|nr:hypothetical protein [Bacteroidales bacterium]